MQLPQGSPGRNFVLSLLIVSICAAFSPGPVQAASTCARVLEKMSWRLDYTITVKNHSSEEGIVTLAVPLLPDERPLQVIRERVIPPGPWSFHMDENNNHCGTWRLKLSACESKPVTFSYLVSTAHVRWEAVPGIYVGSGKRLTPVVPAGARPLQDHEAIQLKKAAHAVTLHETCPYYRILVLYDYLLSAFSFNPGEDRHGPLKSLEKKRLQCSDAALLFCHLVSASGIPSAYAGGLFLEAGNSSFDQFHAWSEVTLPGGVKATIDPTLGRFDAGHRLKCFMERRARYITFWHGEQEPFTVIPSRKDMAVGASFQVAVIPLREKEIESSTGKSPPGTQALKPAKGSLKKWKSTYSPAALTLFRDGRKYQDGKKPDMAVRSYLKALADSPGYREPAEALISIYRLGLSRDMIYDSLKDEVRRRPSGSPARYALGCLELERRHYSLSAEALGRAERDGFTCEELFLAEMRLSALTKETRRFEQALANALSLNRMNMEAYRRGLLFYQDMGMWEQCLALAAEGRVFLPGSAVFPAMQGFALLNRGRFREALPLVDEAISLDPSMGWYHCVRGWILIRLGNMKSAEKEIEKGIQLKKGVTNPDFYRNLLKNPAP